MSNDKHTKEFERIMTNGFAEPTFAQAEAFVSRLSEGQEQDVISKIISKKGKNYCTNKEIYTYCKKNGIEPDGDAYDNYSLPSQTEMNFETPDYSSYKSMDEIEIEGRTGFVLSNDTENKKIIVEFNDNDETETISYEEKKE